MFPDKLHPRTKELLRHSKIYVSAVSIFEIQLKRKIGKLDFTPDIEELIETQVFIPLELKASHSIASIDLPLLHRDPFDRLLIAQSIYEKLPLVTSDKMIQQYDFNFIPA